MRTFSAPALALLASGAVELVILVEMGYSMPIRLATSAVDIPWDGHTWGRAGSLGSIDAVKDTSTGETTGVRFALSAIPAENIALALGDEPARGKACKVWLGLVDPDTWALVEVLRIFVGVLDQMPITQDGDTCTIGVTAEHQGKIFARPKPYRYNASDQGKVSAGDTSMRFLVSQANHQDVWPAAAFFRQ